LAQNFPETTPTPLGISFPVYKYIGFDKAHWAQILEGNQIYFPTTYQLRGGNDPDEFRIDWSTNDLHSMWALIPEDFRKELENIHLETRVLCLSKNFNKINFKNFCNNNGVIYKFTLNESLLHKGLTFRHVTYGQKNRRIFDFVQARIWGAGHTDILGLQEKLNEEFNSFCIDELVFKKDAMNFECESEVRFVHLNGQEPQFSPDHKLPLSCLGLELNEIHTNDKGLVERKMSPGCKVPLILTKF
jgi:hypothetical protein